MTNDWNHQRRRRGSGDAGRDRSALDPAVDPYGWERMVGAIVRAAEGELARRRHAAGLLIDQWARPLLTMAASLILIACGSFLWGSADTSAGGEPMTASVAFEDVLLPPGVARWLSGDAPGTVEELVFTTAEVP